MLAGHDADDTVRLGRTRGRSAVLVERVPEELRWVAGLLNINTSVDSTSSALI